MAIESQTRHQFYHTLLGVDPHASSLTTTDFAWLLAEAWDQPLQEFALASRHQANITNLEAYPSYIPRRKRPCPRQIGVWLLTNHERQPFSWAEAQAFYGPITTLLVTLGPLREVPEFAPAAFGHFISACFLSHRPDVIKLTTSCPHWRQIVNALGLSEGAPLYAPYRQFGLGMLLSQPLARRPQWQLVSPEWWQHPLGQQGRQSLNYLSLRRAREEACPNYCRGKLSFWERIWPQRRRKRIKK